MLVWLKYYAEKEKTDFDPMSKLTGLNGEAEVKQLEKNIQKITRKKIQEIGWYSF